MAINKLNLLRDFVGKLETTDAKDMQAAVLEAIDILEEGDKVSNGDDNGE